MGCAGQVNLLQFLQAHVDAVAHRQIGLQESFVSGQRIAALAGFGIPNSDSRAFAPMITS
jgi:hypothetical protein